jgi:hypothetical protein
MNSNFAADRFTGLPIPRRTLLALPAFKSLAKRPPAPFRRNDPGAIDPGRIMANVLIVSALQLRHPVPLFILMIANDALLHRICSSGTESIQ